MYSCKHQSIAVAFAPPISQSGEIWCCTFGTLLRISAHPCRRTIQSWVLNFRELNTLLFNLRKGFLLSMRYLLPTAADFTIYLTSSLVMLEALQVLLCPAPESAIPCKDLTCCVVAHPGRSFDLRCYLWCDLLCCAPRQVLWSLVSIEVVRAPHALLVVNNNAVIIEWSHGACSSCRSCGLLWVLWELGAVRCIRGLCCQASLPAVVQHWAACICRAWVR